jgi:hypothetical protein
MITPEQRAHLKEALPKRLKWIREEFPHDVNAWVTYCAGYAQGFLHSQLGDAELNEYFTEIAHVVHELLSESMEREKALRREVVKEVLQQTREGRPYVYRGKNQ